MRFVWLLVLVGGCSSPAGRAAPDLAEMGCAFASSGASVAAESCIASVCLPAAGTSAVLNVSTAATFHSTFEVDGTLAAGSYTAAQLRSFDVLLSANGKQYAAGKGSSGRMIAGSSAALSIASATAPSGSACGGVAHGGATATLVEYDSSTGMPTGTGVVNVTLTF